MDRDDRPYLAAVLALKFIRDVLVLAVQAYVCLELGKLLLG